MPEQNDSTLNRRTFLTAATTAGAAMAAGLSPSDAAPDGKKRVCPWFKDIRRMLHLDSHFYGFSDVYNGFDAERAAKMYAEAGFQLVSFFAKCGGGYSYYPTKIGVRHPGCRADYTGELTSALKKRGVRCLHYVAVVCERESHKQHPEWVVNSDPSNWSRDIVVKQESATMCFNSPYLDQIAIPQMKEIVQMYETDGFFIDGIVQPFLQWNCYCPSCREQFAREVGGDIPKNDADPKAFAFRQWANRHMEAAMEKMYRGVASVKPDVAFIFNFTYVPSFPITPPLFIPHITWDTPTPQMGNYSWNFSLQSRYLNTLPDVPFSAMNTRGNNWMDYALREPEAFQHECAILLAARGSNYLSDIPYPSGNPDQPVYDIFGQVNRRSQSLEPLLDGSKPVKEAVVLHSADSVWSKAQMTPQPKWTFSPAYYSMTGAHKALIELHYQMGIINSEVCLDTLGDYRVLILSDQRILGDKETEKIREFVKNGGALLATHETGTRDASNGKLADFALADVFGVKLTGMGDVANCYLRAVPELKPFGIPAMDVEAGGSYTKVTLTTARKLLDLIPPYKGTKGGPPDTQPEGPGVTLNTYGKGNVIYCAADLFGGYFDKDTPNMRKLAAWMLDRVYPQESRLVVMENAPVKVEMFYNERPGERFIHLINYSGDKRDIGTPQAQDFPAVHGMRVKVKLEKKPASLALIPEGKAVNFTYSGGWMTFEALPLRIHDVYRIVL